MQDTNVYSVHSEYHASTMLSVTEKASLEYLNIQENCFKALANSDAIDTCFTFFHLLGNDLYITAAYIISSRRHHNAMPTLTPAHVLLI